MRAHHKSRLPESSAAVFNFGSAGFLGKFVCKALLGEQALPPSLVRSLVQHKGSYVHRDTNSVETPRKGHSIAEAARLHISQGPLLQTPRDGRKALTAFWKDYCAQQQQDPDWEFEYDYA